MIRFRLIFLFPFLFAFEAIGCRIHPPKPQQHNQTQVTLQKQFFHQQASPDSVNTSNTPNAPAPWWRSFPSHELQKHIQAAFAHSPSLSSLWFRLEQSRQMAIKAGASQQPTLNAEAGASYSMQQRIQGSHSTNHNFSVGLVAQYEVDLWGRIKSEKDAALLDITISKLDLEAAAITLSANVAGSYWDYQTELLQIELLDEQLKANYLIRKLIKFRFDMGKTTASDFLRQQELIDARIADRISAIQRLRLHENRLALFMGMTLHEFHAWRKRNQIKSPDLSLQINPELNEDEILKLPTLLEPKLNELIAKGPPVIPNQVPAELITARPDVRRAQQRILASDRRLAAAIADRFPKLTLVARTETSADSINDVFDNWLASIAANLVAPILDGGRRKAEVKRVQAQKQQLIHDYRETVLNSFKEVEDALIQSTQQRALLAQIDVELKTTLELLDVVKQGYIGGKEDYLRVLDALVSYQSLQRQRLSTERNTIQAYIDVMRSLSVSLPADSLKTDEVKQHLQAQQSKKQKNQKKQQK